MERRVRREVWTCAADATLPLWRWRLWGLRLFGTDSQALLQQRGKDTVRVEAIRQGGSLMGEADCEISIESNKVHLLFEVLAYRDHELDDDGSV